MALTLIFSVDSKSKVLKFIPKIYPKYPNICSGKGALKTVHKMSARIVRGNEEEQEEGRRMPAEKEVKEEEKKKEVKMVHPRKEVVFSSLPFAHALTIQVHFT